MGYVFPPRKLGALGGWFFFFAPPGERVGVSVGVAPAYLQAPLLCVSDALC